MLFPPVRVLSPLFWSNVDYVPLASSAQGPTSSIRHHVGSGRRSHNSPCKLGSMSSQVPCSMLLFNVASADFARRPPDAPHFAVTQSASSPLEVRTEANLVRGRHGRHDCCWSRTHECLTSCGSVLFLIFFSEVCSFSSTSNVLRLQCVPISRFTDMYTCSFDFTPVYRCTYVFIWLHFSLPILFTDPSST